MQSITLTNLSNMLLTGSKRVIESKEKINAINIFPVADNDTGNNLASTFSAIEKILRSKAFDATDYMIDAILDAALISSRGNSGMITVSYLAGFLTSLKGKKQFTLKDLVRGLQIGAMNAKKSMEYPIKGTMLDVINSFSSAIEDGSKTNLTSIKEIFYQATQKVRTTLINTENEMEILEKNHIVDAGALGFTFFVYGMYEGISGTRLELTGIDLKPVHNKTLRLTKFPFEIMFMLSKTSFSTQQLKELFHQLGDCLDIVTIQEKIKIHIHTNKPEVVKEMALLTGEVMKLQVVDMRLETASHLL